MSRRTLPILTLVVAANITLWAWMNRPQDEIPWNGVVRGVSFSPYRANEDPQAGRFPTPAEMEQDIQLLSSRVTRLRTYSALDGIDQVPRIAKKYGLPVTAGAWLDSRKDRNDREIRSLVRVARDNSNVERLIVGNESILRGDFQVAELAKILRRVRSQVTQPVSTAEPWHVWIRHPELAKEVDFIAAHILPYWEGVPADNAIAFTMDRYQQLRNAFPDKPILIAEVGWPSHGNRKMQAVASQTNQARFLRRFLNIADKQGMDYFVMEAFDQPWKQPLEGTVGAYWGLLDADRLPKFAMSGPVTENPWWQAEAIFASLIALLPMAWFVSRWRELKSRGRIFYATLIQITASAAIWAACVPFTQYMSFASTLMWGLLLPAQLMILLVMLINGFELTEMTWLHRLRRQFDPDSATPDQRQPKVSIHLAICNEPPHLVNETLDSLARLDYSCFEVIVVDNNTRDPACWAPVAARCDVLNSQVAARFRFFTLGKWPGFKAGALNFALRQTSEDAEVVAVVDADYIVERDWLAKLAPYFNDDKVGFVQAPQDHRDWRGDRFQEICNFEYSGFFHIGMVHRNERDAIIQHGTMTMIRRAALDTLSGWAEWCICEDAELGLRLYQNGYKSIYVNRVFGRGLTAQSFSGYKGQRYRWAYGAVQILKRHWRSLFAWHKSPLSAGQRYHFVTGWAPWFADGLQLVFTVAAVFWSIGLLTMPKVFEFPIAAFLVPTVGMFGFKMLHSIWLYTSHVPSTWRQRLGAALAATALTHSIARAMMKGLFTDNAPFFRTPKAEDKPAFVRAILAAREESLILSGLWLAAIAVAARYGISYSETQLWVAVLMVQSVPYVASVGLSLLNAWPAPRIIEVPATAPAIVPAIATAISLEPAAADAVADRQAA